MGAPQTDAIILLRVTAAKHVLGLLYSWEYPPIADTLLCLGVYSRSLAELAAITAPRMADVEPLFVASLKELEEPPLAAADAAWYLARHCIERIALRGEPPFEPLCLLTQVNGSSAKREVLPDREWIGEALDLGSLVGIYWSYGCPNENVLPSGRVITDEDERQRYLDVAAREDAAAWLARHPMVE